MGITQVDLYIYILHISNIEVYMQSICTILSGTLRLIKQGQELTVIEASEVEGVHCINKGVSPFGKTQQSHDGKSSRERRVLVRHQPYNHKCCMKEE